MNLFVATLKSPRTLTWSAKVASLADRVITVAPVEDLISLPVTCRSPFTSTSAPESSKASAVDDLIVLPATLRSPASVVSLLPSPDIVITTSSLLSLISFPETCKSELMMTLAGDPPVAAEVTVNCCPEPICPIPIVVNRKSREEPADIVYGKFMVAFVLLS